nr:hypothetical protein [Tanacetum cinerariifolium]
MLVLCGEDDGESWVRWRVDGRVGKVAGKGAGFELGRSGKVVGSRG